MSFITSVRALSQNASTSEGFEKYAAEELRKDPNNAMVLEAAAHHYWRMGSYEASFDCATRAVKINADSREMFLVAAASAFHLDKLELATRYARMALECEQPTLNREFLAESGVFRLLVRIPLFRARLTALKNDWEERSEHEEKLLDWAREFVNRPAADSRAS